MSLNFLKMSLKLCKCVQMSQNVNRVWSLLERGVHVQSLVHPCWTCNNNTKYQGYSNWEHRHPGFRNMGRNLENGKSHPNRHL